jgi:hypothetical protein
MLFATDHFYTYINLHRRLSQTIFDLICNGMSRIKRWKKKDSSSIGLTTTMNAFHRFHHVSSPVVLEFFWIIPSSMMAFSMTFNRFLSYTHPIAFGWKSKCASNSDLVVVLVSPTGNRHEQESQQTNEQQESRQQRALGQ